MHGDGTENCHRCSSDTGGDGFRMRRQPPVSRVTSRTFTPYTVTCAQGLGSKLLRSTDHGSPVLCRCCPMSSAINLQAKILVHHRAAPVACDGTHHCTHLRPPTHIHTHRHIHRSTAVSGRDMSSSSPAPWRRSCFPSPPPPPPPACFPLPRSSPFCREYTLSRAPMPSPGVQDAKSPPCLRRDERRFHSTPR